MLLPALAVGAFAVFLPALWSGFVADDYVLLVTVDRFQGVWWAFTHNSFGAAGTSGYFYRPVWVLFNTAVFELFGNAALPIHASSFVLFAIAVVEVRLLAGRMLDRAGAWVAAIVFAVYPRHGESVAWISGNTDLLATVLALAALLCLVAPWRLAVRASTAAAFTAAAGLSKESTFVLPLLAALALLATGGLKRDRGREAAVLLGAVVLPLIPVAVARTLVLEGLGGYSYYPWTPLRAAASLASYVAAALSPPQLQLLRYPALLAIPALLAAVIVWAGWRLWRRGDSGRWTVLAVGIVWFFVALVPVLNLPVDLNNGGGERLLFLSSVGLALALGALVSVSTSRRRAAFLVACGVAAVLCIQSGYTWVGGGRIADRVLDEAVRLGPPNGRLLLLSLPEMYRNARVFSAGLDAAVTYAGRPDLHVVFCVPVQVLDARGGQVRFQQSGDGSYAGTTTWDVPFDFPVVPGSEAAIGSACTYSREGRDWPPGLGLHARVRPAPSSGPTRRVVFDGHDLRPLGGSRPAQLE